MTTKVELPIKDGFIYNEDGKAWLTIKPGDIESIEYGVDLNPVRAWVERANPPCKHEYFTKTGINSNYRCNNCNKEIFYGNRSATLLCQHSGLRQNGLGLLVCLYCSHEFHKDSLKCAD